MKKLNIIILTLIGLIDLSCQKRKYPEDLVKVSKEDIFFIGSVDNKPINLKVGAEAYYCYSSYNQNNDSIYRFIGELKKYECEVCPQSMRLELSDYKQRLPEAAIDAETVFELGNRGFISKVSKINTLKYSASSNKQISTIRWDVSNGISSQDSILKIDYSFPGPQTVSLTIETNGNCKSTIVSKIFVGGENGIFASNVVTSVLSTRTASFSSTIIGGKAPFNYNWSFGDGSSSNLAMPIHNYQFTGSYPVKLIIEDAEQNVCESNYIFITGDDNSSCNSKISTTLFGSRDLIYSGVKIQWVDESNIVFSSDELAQTEESYFEILDSKDYKKNERGEAGRLLTVRFNVLISDGKSKMWFKTDNAAIAVTYK